MSGPPLITIRPKLELKVATKLPHEAVVFLHQVAVDEVLGSASSITIETVLMKDLDICVVLVRQRNGQGSVEYRKAVVCPRRVSSVVDGVVDQ